MFRQYEQPPGSTWAGSCHQQTKSFRLALFLNLLLTTATLMLGFFKRKETPDNTDPRLKRNETLLASIDLGGLPVLAPDKISLGKVLGTGGFGKAYLCQLRAGVGDEPCDAVCKAINVEKLNDDAKYLLTNECTIWSKLKHPNIVGFYGMSCTSTSIMLLCEFMPDGSLLEAHEKFRKQRKPMPTESELIVQLAQVASGMAYLHALEPPVLHRDLKSANILLGNGGERLAIADFGLARFEDTHKKMTAETGSYRWMAPEVIRHEMYDWRCDVYSYAVLAWEMLTYRIPFDDMMPVEAALAVAKEGRRPPIPKECPESVQHMLEQCWHQQAVQRPSFMNISAALSEEAALVHGPSGGVPAPATADDGIAHQK